MPRHSKNNSDGAHFTYAERATMATTVGSTVARLGGDSLRPYHHCCLSLAPARDPVLTPGGHLYDKPAILAALLAQRRTARAARAAAADAAAADAAAARGGVHWLSNASVLGAGVSLRELAHPRSPVSYYL